MPELKVLNLGCGYRTSDRAVNIDFSIPIRLRANPVARRLAPVVLGSTRLAEYNSVDGEVRCHDLRKGIPFPDRSIDVVYHSHVLEHLDRDVVPRFFAEVRRVLRPGGIHRVVVPDLELQARAYLRTLTAAEEDPARMADHDQSVWELVEQLVRTEAYGSSIQSPVRRRIENLLLGSARRRGQTHRWMWDRLTLCRELELAGFTEPAVMTNTTSRVADWRSYGLDETDDGSEYKAGSLYVEAVR